MSEHQSPAIQCTVCGRGLQAQDIVIVSREVVPRWATSVEHKTTEIVHRTCEAAEGRADHSWVREPPQTLAHALAILAVERPMFRV